MKKINYLIVLTLSVVFMLSCSKDEPNNGGKVPEDKNAVLLLPFLELGKTKEEIKTFEQNRGSVLGTAGSEDKLMFDTKSSLCNKVQYIFEGDKYKDATVFCPTLSKNLDKYKALLKEKGFVEKGGDYLNSSLKIRVSFTSSSVKYVGDLKPPVVDDKPSFSKFPDFYMDWGSKEAELLVWENTKNGEEDTNASQRPLKVKNEKNGIEEEKPVDFIVFNVKAGKEEKQELPDIRSYYVIHKDYTTDSGISHLKGVRVTNHYYRQISAFFYVTNTGEELITKAFKKLAKEAGFEHKGVGESDFEQEKQIHIFENKEKNLKMTANLYDLKGVPVVDLTLTEIEEKPKN